MSSDRCMSNTKLHFQIFRYKNLAFFDRRWISTCVGVLEIIFFCTYPFNIRHLEKVLHCQRFDLSGTDWALYISTLEFYQGSDLSMRLGHFSRHLRHTDSLMHTFATLSHIVGLCLKSHLMVVGEAFSTLPHQLFSFLYKCSSWLMNEYILFQDLYFYFQFNLHSEKITLTFRINEAVQHDGKHN